MNILQSFITMLLFIISALAGAFAPKLKRFGAWVLYAGGFCMSTGIVTAYISGAKTQEILIAVMLIGLIFILGKKDRKGDKNEL